MKHLILLLVITLVIIFYYHWARLYLNLIRVKAGPVHREWNVVGTYENKRDAAELLAKVNSRMIEFMRFLKKKYHIDESDDTIAAEGDAHSKIIHAPGDVYNIIDHLLDNYNPDVFYENDPRIANDTSYTLNKGSSMYICLRRKDDPTKLVDENTLLFVILHEASHIANYNDFGHSRAFWQTFKFILHEAVLTGIYKPIDYEKHPVNYCGLTLSWSPLYDTSLKDIWK